MPRRIDLAGMKFGAWEVLSYAGQTYTTMWQCRCVCGAVVNVSGENLRSGASTNCGCLRQYNVTHGHARRGARSATNAAWKGMLTRCRPEYRDAKNYFERGISVCDRWHDFTAFLADMGETPPSMTLDRIDNDRGYEPGNCRWTDRAVQRRNSRRIVFVDLDGEQIVLKDAAARIGVSDTAIHQEIKRNGGSPQDAFDRVRARRS